MLVFLAVLLADGRRAESAPEARGWDYVVSADDKLERLQVRLCFRRFLPKRMGLPKVDALDALRHPEAGRGQPTLRRTPDGKSLVPVGLKPGGCIEYEVDLTRLRRGGTLRRVGRDVLLAPGAVFVRPTLWPSDTEVTVRFELPEGLGAAVPWARTADGRAYSVDRFAFQLMGRIALGRMRTETIAAAGTQVQLTLFDGHRRSSIEGIRTWATGAVNAVADLFDGFPTRRVLIHVQPVASRGEPVLFGRAMRAGGGHAHVLLSALARDEDLPGEWVLVHELTHLGMPWTYDQEAWIQEGFVTYYQEVLRARAGFLTEREAWQNIENGFGRGRRRGGERVLAAESRDMHREHNYHRVYWAGAAIALRVDVELRRASGGTRSLDDVMRILHRRFGGTRGPHAGVDLLRAADRALGLPVSAAVAEHCLERPDFPDVGPAYRALGIRVVDGRVRLDDEAPMADERKRIMSPRGGRPSAAPR